MDRAKIHIDTSGIERLDVPTMIKLLTETAEHKSRSPKSDILRRVMLRAAELLREQAEEFDRIIPDPVER